MAWCETRWRVARCGVRTLPPDSPSSRSRLGTWLYLPDNDFELSRWNSANLTLRAEHCFAMVAAGFEFRGVWLAIALTQVAKGLGATAWFRVFSDRRLAADLEGGGTTI